MAAAATTRARRTLGPEDEDERPLRRAVGVVGTPLYGGRIDDLDPNPEVRAELWRGTPDRRGIADEIILDPVIKRSHDSVKGPLLGALWDMDPASEDAQGLEVADLCEHILFERLPWHRILDQSMTYLRYGTAVFEYTDALAPVSRTRFPLHPGRGRGYVVSGLHHRPAPTIAEWIPDATDPSRVAAMRQWGAGSDVERAGLTEPIDARYLVRLTWEQEGGNFWGFAPARPQYAGFKSKVLCLVLEMIKHERAHVPTPVIELGGGTGTFEVTDDEIEEARKVLRDLRSHERGYAILPNGMKLTLATIDGTTDIHQTITRCDEYNLMVFAAGYERLGSQGSPGSHAMAGTQKSTQEITLDRHAAFICEAFNVGADGHSLIERIVRENYGPGVPLPRLVVRALPTRDWSKVLPVVRNLGEIGFITPGRKTERFIRWVLALPQETEPYVPEGSRARVGGGTPAAEKRKLDDEAFNERVARLMGAIEDIRGTAGAHAADLLARIVGEIRAERAGEVVA